MGMEERSARALGFEPAPKLWHRIVVSVLEIFGGLAWLFAVVVLIIAFVATSESPLGVAFVLPLILSSVLSGALLFGLASLIALLLDLRTHAELQAAVTLKQVYDRQAQQKKAKDRPKDPQG